MSGYAWSARRPSPGDIGRAGRDVAIGALAAGAVGLLVGTSPFYALLLPVALVAVWLTVRPRAAAVALGATIPAVAAVGLDHLGLHIGLGDPVLVLLFLAATGAAALERNATTFTMLRPAKWPVLQYCVFVLVLFCAHPGVQPLLQTLQRYELIVFPLVIGSYLVIRGVHVTALKAYIVAASVIAVMFPFVSLGLQKNPAGQFVADALLLVIGVPRLARYRILVPVLVWGMFATESRGAIVACAVGVTVILDLRWTRSPQKAAATGFAIVAIAVLAFAVMPPSTQAFITSYGSTGNTNAAWNVRFRQGYDRDALQIIRAHPWLGVGVGSYGNATAAAQLTAVSDPHEVLLLQAAEGGWAFAASFVVLILGTALVLFRVRQTELAAAAIAILLATAVHGLVDVYWVRGTPVLGWLLTGMVCASLLRQREPTPTPP
jgi:hypothetical protein